MKRLNGWKKTMLPAALALALIIPAAAYAAEQSGQSDGSGSAPSADSSAPAQPGGKARFGKGHGGFDHRGPGGFGGGTLSKTIGDKQVNQRKYMELLAEKYAPDTLADWQAALDRQEALGEELKALLQDQGVHDALKAQKEELQQQWKTKRDELKQKLENGEITKEQLREQAKDGSLPFGRGIKGGVWEGDAAELQDARTHRQELTDAIKADNADGIRAALANVLGDVKQANDAIAAKIAELKPKATGQTVQPKAPKQSQPDAQAQSPAKTQSWKAQKANASSASTV
ncbi:hypothetical protein [Paenibacillus flagellatus]|uniref:Uncharacterized protein n=1 Tax=Paenibacillus flagellatus TaxID=2211139 RepID=A0A2V5KFU3_9BACL|nr:hypothetical protein [Paenibacillus flagellatus]PYI57414.1 hypothetical protein DLM86_02960 [Paenibacillus flagellatus]